MTGEARRPALLPGGAIAAAAATAASPRPPPQLSRRRASSAPPRSPPGAAPAPAHRLRQGLPRRPLPRGAAVPGSDHPRHGRAVRPRHGRGAGGAVRRPGDGSGQGEHRPASPRLRRRPARPAHGRGEGGPARIHAQRDQLRASAFAGTLRGGGSDPDDPAAFSSVAASSPYQATGCDALGFGPQLYLRVFGATKRAKNPKLRAVLLARPGDANIARAAVDPAEVADPRPGEHRPASARGSSSPPANARRTRSTGSPKPTRRCSTGRSRGRSTCAPRTTPCRTSSPPSTARSTSSWPAGPTASAAGSATPSTPSPTSRSRASC